MSKRVNRDKRFAYEFSEITPILQSVFIISATYLQIYGNGRQTRSFQYVSDLIDGLVALMTSEYTQPVNIGNPVEHTIEGSA